LTELPRDERGKPLAKRTRTRAHTRTGTPCTVAKTRYHSHSGAEGKNGDIPLRVARRRSKRSRDRVTPSRDIGTETSAPETAQEVAKHARSRETACPGTQETPSNTA